jgi:predicted DNA-binding protein (MmcQ/YjbR family)
VGGWTPAAPISGYSESGSFDCVGPQQVDDFALKLPFATEDEPFGPGANVYRIGGKMFAILQPGDGVSLAQVTLKCEPGLAVELRAQYPAVIAGYHVNKKHWNTVILDGSVPDDELREMIEHSYQRVLGTLPKAIRSSLSNRQ